MHQNHLRIAFRNLAKNKTFTLFNILGLTVGIGSCLIIYLLTSFELSYDNFHSDKERIYRIVAKVEGHGRTELIGGMMLPLPEAIRREGTGFETLASFYHYSAKVTVPNSGGANPNVPGSIPNSTAVPRRFDAANRDEEPSPIIIAQPSWFDIFHYQWLEGNPATALKEPFTVVLTVSEAYKYFGRQPLPDIIGRDLFYSDIWLPDSLHLTVSGIIKDWGQNTDLGFKDIISYATIPASFLKKEIQLDHWGNWNPNAQAFVKLSPGSTPAQTQRQFPALLKAHLPPYPGFTTTLSLQPLSDIHFDSRYREAYTRKAHLPTLRWLMGIALFILILAVINFVNLSTAQSLSRAKEVGVRKVLGSSRAALSWQFLVETFSITAIAAIISVAIAYPVIHSIGPFHSMVPEGMAGHLFSPSTLLFITAITLVTSLLAGFYPARVLSAYSPVISLKGNGPQPATGGSSLRKTLIVFQFTISLLFIIGTFVIGDQIRFIRNKDLGFDKDAILTFRTGFNQPVDRAALFAQRLRQVPAIGLVSTHLETPAAKDHSRTYLRCVDIPDDKVDASYELCDENYVPLYGIKIIAGHNITHSDTVKEFLINETAAKGLGFANPQQALSRTVETGMNNGRGQIVGVIKDFHAQSLHEAVTPFFISSDKRSQRAISIKLATGAPASTGNPASTGAPASIGNLHSTLVQVEKIWKETYPGEKFQYSFFDESIARLYEREEKTAFLMNAATAIAIFVSCMGLFGLSAFTTRQRVKEIGIRKVLGASVADIVALLSGAFLKLVLLAMIIASPIAWWFLQGWLSDFAYRISIDGWVFLLAGLTALGIALITISFQTIKAAIANPIKSLRTE